MKRITVSIDDEMYACLVDYAEQASKEDILRLSVSRAIRQLITIELSRLSYYPMAQKKKEALHTRNLIRDRERQKINDRNDPFILMQQQIVAR